MQNFCRRAAYVLVLGSGLLTAPAMAHPRLLATSPAAAATGTSPARLTLRFSEPLVARFSGIVLKDAQGRAIALQPLQLSTDRKQLSASPVQRLAPGAYTTAWHAVSTDTHRVEGITRFTVR